MNTLPIDLYKVISMGLVGTLGKNLLTVTRRSMTYFKLMVLNLKQPSWIILSPSLLRASA